MATLKDIKTTVLSMIEEINPNSELLTDDTDIQNKINSVINLVTQEVARMKKMPAYVELDVAEGDLVKFEDIATASDYKVYQLGNIKGVNYELKANGTIIKALETGTIEIDFFRYPETITAETSDDHELELSEDALGIIPYGVAGDLLKSDVSASYGEIYYSRYETMLQRLDPRYSMGSFTIEGGVNI